MRSRNGFVGAAISGVFQGARIRLQGKGKNKPPGLLDQGVFPSVFFTVKHPPFPASVIPALHSLGTVGVHVLQSTGSQVSAGGIEFIFSLFSSKLE